MTDTEDRATRRVAAVTGGTRGIGRAVAEALLEEGFSVLSGGRTARDNPTDGDRDRFAVLDVRDAQSCTNFVAEAIREFGSLDVLVNNAGVGVFAPMEELTLEDWDLQIQTNLNGPFYCTKAALPHLVESQGWVINIASLASRHPFKGGVAYNASKYGLLGFGEALMLDVRHQGVRATTIMPGSVDTAFFGREPGAEDWRLAPEDVARAVVDLLRYPHRAHPSRVELRPSQPPKR